MAKKERNKKQTPMAGDVRIQTLCPVPSSRVSWRALILDIDSDDDKPKILVDDDGDPKYILLDIACWALLVEESGGKRYQDIWPCVPTSDGVVEPVNPEDDEYVGIVPPSFKKKDVEEMVTAAVEELNLPTMIEPDFEEDGGEAQDREEYGDTGDEEGGDDDQE